VLIYHEKLTPSVLAGVILVLSAVVLINRER
jgi:drug/metabolite transporter (DMT)-like permease